LLPEEEKIYKNLLSLFDGFRRNVLHQVLTNKLPNFEEEQPKTIKRAAKTNNPGFKLVRFLEPVQQFVGPDLEPVGPFKKDDMATLPEKVVQVLLNKESIEIVEEK